MDLIQKVDELIELFETTCKNICASAEERTLINIDLTPKISFSYHVDTGAMMFTDNVWYLNEKDMYKAPNVTTIGIHQKLGKLISLHVISIDQFEAMIFKLI